MIRLDSIRRLWEIVSFRSDWCRDPRRVPLIEVRGVIGDQRLLRVFERQRRARVWIGHGRGWGSTVTVGLPTAAVAAGRLSPLGDVEGHPA